MTAAMRDPLGGVQIGAREIYDEVKSTQQQIATIDTKVDRLADSHDEVRRDVVDHEARLRALEKGRWPLPALTVLLSVGALVVAVVGLWLKGS